MRLHKRLVFPLAVALGAAVVVLPAAAASENPTINAYSYLGTHYWTPMEVTVSGGGSVAIRNSSEEVKHGVEWKSGPETPSCEGVPVGTTEAASATKWSGTCTFKAPGTYVFWCTVHHSEMKATVVVSPSGTTTTTTTTAPTPTPTPTPTLTPGAPGVQPNEEQSGGASPLAGSASSAFRLASVQHGRAVHASLALSQASDGGRLEVQLLARSASLAAARQTSVGRLVRSGLRAGRMTFAVALNAKGRRALRAHRRLPLTVKLVLTPAHGKALAITRSVLLRP